MLGIFLCVLAMLAQMGVRRFYFLRRPIFLQAVTVEKISAKKWRGYREVVLQSTDDHSRYYIFSTDSNLKGIHAEPSTAYEAYLTCFCDFPHYGFLYRLTPVEPPKNKPYPACFGASPTMAFHDGLPDHPTSAEPLDNKPHPACFGASPTMAFHTN